jgi:hypothetical protein
MNDELKTAIAFARLELLELEHGRRTLAQCPGVENVARAIAAAKKSPQCAHGVDIGKPCAACYI